MVVVKRIIETNPKSLKTWVIDVGICTELSTQTTDILYDI